MNKFFITLDLNILTDEVCKELTERINKKNSKKQKNKPLILPINVESNSNIKLYLPKNRVRRTLSKIEKLSYKDEIDQMIYNNIPYTKISEFIKSKNDQVSKSAVARYSQKLLNQQNDYDLN